MFFFVYFDGRNGTQDLTGNLYAYSPLQQNNLNVTIQQTQYPSTSTISYNLFKDGQQISGVQVTSPSPAVFSFPINTSTLAAPTGYKVQYQQSQVVDINSLYSS